MQPLLIVYVINVLLIITHCEVALTPPRGWNSYQCYSNPNETQIIETGQAMNEFLLPYGYNYLVIDAGWYADLETGKGLIIDEYGRLQPDPLRYPSSSNNKGFKKLSNTLSTMGLKLGIHVMKGISIAAINANTPVYGTNNKIFAKDIVNMSDVCPWWNQFYGLNMSANGAQKYIDSLYSQYIQDWNISFIKNDCIFGNDYTPDQIIAVSNTINKYTDSTHNVVYSLSPGLSIIPPSNEAEHIHKYVNQYRITNDNWDYYKDVLRPFNVSSEYAVSQLYNASGLNGRSWIDLDIMPFGYILSHNNRNKPDVPTSLSYGEQRCEMTLWSITRSSLMFGGLVTEFVKNPNNKFNNFTLSLITNKYALDVNAFSNNNKQISSSFNSTGYVTNSVWYADILSTSISEYFVAMFNLQMENNYEFNISLNKLNMNNFKQCDLFDIWNNKNVGETVDGFIVQSVTYHDVSFLKLTNCN